MAHVAGIKKKNSRRSPLDTADTYKSCPLLDSVAFTCITGRRHGGEGIELLQQGFDLTLHSHGGSRAVFVSHRFQQLVKTSAGVTKVRWLKTHVSVAEERT